MSRDAVSGGAIVAGTIGGLATMALHPAGLPHDGTAEQIAAVMRLAVIAHGLGIASIATVSFGALGLLRRLVDTPELARAAFVAFAFAAVAGMCAAIASGLILPALHQHLADADAAQRVALGVVEDWSWFFNQGFAKVHVVGTSVAIALWSLALLRAQRPVRGLGFYGITIGVAAVAALGSGFLPLNVHGFGLVVLAQAIWWIGAGLMLWRPEAGIAA